MLAPIALIKATLTGGDKVSETVRRAWDECFGVPLLDGYGLSETLGGALINMLGDEDHTGNVGRAFPGIEIRLVAKDGSDVPDGTAGELWCKSAFLFSGYWKQPELTREVLVDGWFKTEDLAVRTSSGVYRILGRRDFMIMRATLNISPVELEAVIQTYPAIKDCMVSGFPSEQLGQDVEAFLIFDGQLPLTEFKAYLMERLGAAFCPSRFWSVTEIPKTSMGKVDRRAAEKLRAQATRLDS
jgi:long-chain acyl-CoA synthetase